MKAPKAKVTQLPQPQVPPVYLAMAAAHMLKMGKPLYGQPQPPNPQADAETNTPTQ